MELRDTHGTPLPLSRCRTCGTYYLSERGECRWCGTPADSADSSAPVTASRRAVWIGAGVVVLLVAGWGGARFFGKRDKATRPAVTAPLPTPIPTLPIADTSTHAGNAPDSGSAADSTAPAQATTTPVPIDPTEGPDDVRWLTATARTWANVRADASRDADIVAVIPPNTRVQLGDLQSGWIRLRSGGVEGWVDRRLFDVDSVPPR